MIITVQGNPPRKVKRRSDLKSPMRPMMSYYGGKWRAAPHYPAPKHQTIIEPFAGGAGYSLRYHFRDVILVEKSPKISAVWRYLINADPARILALPDIGEEGVAAHDDLTDAERWLIGLWLNAGAAAPRLTPSAWMRAGKKEGKFWGKAIRRRLASQCQKIRHWRIIEGNYTDAPDIEATWFIDPPYQRAGTHYPFSLGASEYEALGGWCRDRTGQVLVCEAAGADWLPFRPFRRVRAITKGGVGRYSQEVLWERAS